MSSVKISVIIPTYNVEEYIDELIESLYIQSYGGTVECLFYDDGSSDSTIEKIQANQERFEKRGYILTLISDGENLKQGARRNQGIKKAQGEYVLFLDGDDFLHSDTLSITYNEILKDPGVVDMVFFNYAYENKNLDRQKQVIPQIPAHIYKDGNVLVGEDVELLLSLSPYFTVNKLYRREFLVENSIYFGEGYFYEDVEFFVKSATKANKMRLTNNVLYYVRVNENSTTKTKFDSTIHVDDFYKAILATYDGFESRRDTSVFFLARYLTHRSLIYINQRMPENKGLRLSYLRKLLKEISKNIKSDDIPQFIGNPLFYFIFKLDYFERLDVKMINKIYNVSVNDPVLLRSAMNTSRSKSVRMWNRLEKKIFNHKLLINLSYIKSKFKSSEKNTLKADIESNNKLAQDLSESVLMLGFDYKYEGNSKYLFNAILEDESIKNIKFVTCDEAVPEAYRVEPRSEEFFELLATSKVVIAESWVPLAFELSDEQTLIQLWHGTPMKKILYDSQEKFVLKSNPQHKLKKKWDINRWDYLFADSEFAARKFKTAFSLEDDDIQVMGYPRVNWLVENETNAALKTELREKLGVSSDKKIVTYLPTWRDYNYKTGIFDNNYELNFNRFKKHLGELSSDLVYVYKSHNMSGELAAEQLDTILNPEIDTQERLLISDIIITDYSSVAFDALYINKPVYFLFKDYDFFETDRGVYDELLEVFEPVIAYSDKELAEKITTYYLDSPISNQLGDILNKNPLQINENIIKLIQKNLSE